MKNKNKLSKRQSTILKHLKEHGRVFVEELAILLGTSPQTIRKDLQVLEDCQQALRFHGGASMLAGTQYTDFERRTGIAAIQKKMIGTAVAKLIPNNSVLFINVGTTTAAVSYSLSQHVGLRIITDNVSIADVLRTYSGVEVIIPGGNVRRSDGVILGETAVDFISQFRADIAIIGAAAISDDGTLLDYDLREAHICRTIIENARHIILAADSSKFGSSATVKIGHLSNVNVFVTDDRKNTKSERLQKLCRKYDVNLIKAAT